MTPPSGAEAAHQPYGAHRGRLDLGAALPLDTPLSVLIDPANACNFKCVFCATGDDARLAAIGRPKGLLRPELFAKIVDDLAAFPQSVKSVHLYKDGEPLLNKHLPAMVRQLKVRSVARWVEITTNGSLLTPERADALIDAGLDGIRISVYGTSDAEYRRTTRTFGAYATVLDNVRYLHRRKIERNAALHIHCKIIDSGLDAGRRQSFFDDFAPLADSVYGHARHDEVAAQAGTVSGSEGGVPGRRVCSEPFIKLAINVDGAVSACCADWSMSLIVGDVTRQSLVEIWNGAPLHALRRTHLAGRRHMIPACRDCVYVATLPADNDLDGVAAALAGRYAARAAPGPGLLPAGR